MKKSKIIVLIIIFVTITALAVFAVMNRNNISAVYRFLKYSESDIQSQLADAKNSLLDSIKEYGFTDNIRDFTEEEEKKLSDGELTPEQAVELMFSSSKTERDIADDTENSEKIPENENAAENVQPEETTASASDQTPQDSTISDDDFEAQMKEYVKMLYTVKADFTAKLGEVERNIKADYSALDESERTLSGKQKIVMKYWNQIVSLEKECDEEIEKVVSSLKTFLSENDLDTSLCNMIKRYYDEEKELKKAAYMKQLTN